MVMEILGHSSFALTTDRYVYVMGPLLHDAAKAEDLALRRK
jgi:hypothetical protein